jgi:hypothetical protein
VKLLRLDCRSSACGLRRVPKFLVFESSLIHKIQCSAKVCVSKCHRLCQNKKGKKCFQLHYTSSDTLPSCSPLPFHLPVPTFSDVAEARIYFASTVLASPYRGGHETPAPRHSENWSQYVLYDSQNKRQLFPQQR